MSKALDNAMAKAVDIVSRPHRNGTVDLVIRFSRQGEETALFRMLNAALRVER